VRSQIGQGHVTDEGTTMSGDLVRRADAAQYEREPIPETGRGKITVRLLNATPDPLGSIAALCAQYEGRVIRNLSEVTDEERRKVLDDMGKTVLNGPLEAAQFHWQIEGVTRSITHQMVRSRASFFAQESLRFAVPEGDWAREIPLPPSLAGIPEARRKYLNEAGVHEEPPEGLRALNAWERAMSSAQNAYAALIKAGVPAEEARGVLPHDMPTRIHVVHDLRTLLAEAGKRTCTQAQFPWRVIFAGMAKALREYRAEPREVDDLYVTEADGWQFREIANRLRPVCYQTGQCGFMAAFDRSCSIRSRVDAFAAFGMESKFWGNKEVEAIAGANLKPINDAEWAVDPGAARS
jgi:flavin-dependent thymidylate synthase